MSLNQKSSRGKLAFAAAFFAALMVGCVGLEAREKQECCEDPLNAKAEDVSYRTLKSAGVLIPIFNQRVLEGNRVQFDIDKRKIKKFAFIFAKTAGVYVDGAVQKNATCPYIDVPDEYTQRENLDRHTLRITMNLNEELVALVTEHQCVVGLKPKP